MLVDDSSTLNYLTGHRIKTTQALIFTAQVQLLHSEHRLALSLRRVLLPIAGGADGASALPTRRQRTREKARRGELPPQNGAQVWAGNGTGLACGGCAERITKLDQEYEIVFANAVTLRLHRECFVAWTAAVPEHAQGGREKTESA